MTKRHNGYPMKLEQWYERRLNKLVRKWQAQVLQFTQLYLKKYVVGGTKILHDTANDDPNWMDSVQQVLNLFAVSMQASQDEHEINSIITKWYLSVNNFSLQKFKKYSSSVQLQAGTIAINPLVDSPTLQNYAKGKIAEDTALIKTLHQRYIGQLQTDIYRNITNGGGVADITHAINNRTGMALKHANLIATDQTGKALSQIDAYRSQQVGFTEYVWRSMEDGRVRPKHKALDGKTFKYNDPNGGDAGQLPGEPIRCRCYAEPKME